jgi:CheY-like chemotaxis protein
VVALRVADYDAVLMDCQMPEMDGFQATGEIRRLELSTGRHVPILAMTGTAMQGDREMCLQAGMDDYPRNRCISLRSARRSGAGSVRVGPRFAASRR